MIRRLLHSVLVERLNKVPAVALLGSRQVGKTTIALSLALDKPLIYLDLERPSDLMKLEDAELFLGQLSNTLVVIDEVQRKPDLFPLLRSLIDERRRNGERAGQFLLLGSALPDLLKQGSETLAGRISYIEMTPFLLSEVASDVAAMDRHWMRGGYPESYLASDDSSAMLWCNDFITSYIERYLPLMGVAASAVQLRRFCTMIAHQQSAIVNLTQVGNSLGIDSKTVRSYLDLLEGLYLIRRIPAWTKNVGKRLVKSPKVMWRDSGLLHDLLSIEAMDRLLEHPICGHSWEAYCIEQICNVLPKGTSASYYRTQAGAEIDLVLEDANGSIHAIEIKRTLSPKLSRSLIESMTSIQATSATIIIPRGNQYPLSEKVLAMGLPEFLSTLWES